MVNLFLQHGLLALFVGVFIEQIGAPTPALPLFMLAGARGHSDALFLLEALAAGTVAAMIADVCWYFAGRHFGRRVLSLLCRVSLSPDTCVRKSEASFGRHGATTVLRFGGACGDAPAQARLACARAARRLRQLAEPSARLRLTRP